MVLLMIGTTELVLIAGLALLLFGGKKLPELMKGMGQGVRCFKEGMNAPAEEPQPEEAPNEDEPVDENAPRPDRCDIDQVAPCPGEVADGDGQR